MKSLARVIEKGAITARGLRYIQVEKHIRFQGEGSGCRIEGKERRLGFEAGLKLIVKETKERSSGQNFGMTIIKHIAI